ncbi:MAG: glucosylceramidase [Fibrobacter sp.]|jgi:uncharacterized protein (DUF608 family)|nr:glucosylceramidase [Fibrobacter sp.]
MNFDRYLESSKLNGSVKHLMTPGLAVEFIQPWYTPLSTTPSTTGIAVGGVGSTFTVTPAGTTPVMNVVPGLQVRADRPEDIRLNDFFFRESVVAAASPLVIENFSSFTRKLATYPLLGKNGAPLFTQTKQSEAEKKLNEILKDKKFYETNQAAFTRWHVEFSDLTKSLLENGDRSSPLLNRAVLIDFFDGVIGEKIARKGALTAAWESESTFLNEDGFDAEKMDYAALYPVSRTEFKNPKGVAIKRFQYSYVTPGNERLSSLPLSATRYELSNPTQEIREVTIVQMQNNFCGYQVAKDRQGVQDSSFVLILAARNPRGVEFSFDSAGGRKTKGVEFYNKNTLTESDFNGCMSISVTWNSKDSVNVSAKPMFYQDDAKTVLRGALQSGRLSANFSKNVYSGRETLAGALAVTVRLKPKAKVSFQFNTVLDFPHIRLNGLTSEKKYTAFFPEAYGRIQAMLTEVLNLEDSWLSEITGLYAGKVPPKEVRKLYPKNKAGGEHFKSLAINTMSFLAEATVWDKEDRFLVRECADYPFFNSLDVYFYGSFSLLALLPRLDGAVMRRFADAILAVDTKHRRHHEYVNHPFADLPDPKLEGERAVRGAVIHDLGSPFDAKPDAYDWHNVKEWKDLAPKFVLMVLRHYRMTGDKNVLSDTREAVYACMEYLGAMVEPGQNFPLTHGTDDTFDNLSSHGISVYCGSLWIAGLRAAAEIADILGDETQKNLWKNAAVIAAEEFHLALWDETEGYFHFFVTPAETKDLVEANLGALRKAAKTVLDIPETPVEAVKAINAWLCDENRISGKKLSRREVRAEKKAWLTGQCPQAFMESWNAKLTLDNDDVFVDTMLADTYLRLLGLEPVTDSEKAKRTLKRIFLTNYKQNSPLLGAANLVHKNGEPLDEFNFQAHDVWIGIQYSIATSMIMHGLKPEACDILESMVRNLYDEARIPFAAPEGFNGSSRLHPEQLEKNFGISKPVAKKLHQNLMKAAALLPDSRISPKLSRNLSAFQKTFGKMAREAKVDVNELFTLLHHTALKYTAGKYFRPGMVFAVIEAAKQI